VLLPKEVSPYRIDFPKIKLAQVKSVKFGQPSRCWCGFRRSSHWLLHQRIEKDRKRPPHTPRGTH